MPDTGRFDQSSIWATPGVPVVEKLDGQIVVWKEELKQRKMRTAKLENKDGVVLNPAAIHATGGAPAVLRKQTQGMRWFTTIQELNVEMGMEEVVEEAMAAMEEVQEWPKFKKVCVSYIVTLTNLENIEANASSSDSDENILETTLCGLFYSL